MSAPRESSPKGKSMEGQRTARPLTFPQENFKRPLRCQCQHWSQGVRGVKGKSRESQGKVRPFTHFALREKQGKVKGKSDPCPGPSLKGNSRERGPQGIARRPRGHTAIRGEGGSKPLSLEQGSCPSDRTRSGPGRPRQGAAILVAAVPESKFLM